MASGVDGVVVSAATPAHAELTLAAVERGLPTFCEKPIASTAAESARVAEAIARSGVPVQVGYQRRFDAAFAAAKRAVDDGSLGAAAHRAQHHDGPRAAADGLHRGLGRHLPRLRGARFRRDPVDHRTAGGRGVRHRQRAGRPAVRRVRRRRHRGGGGDVRRRARSAWCPRPATTATATTAGWRCTGSTTPWSPAGIRVCRCEMSIPATSSRPDRRTTSSWTASPTRSAPS